VWQSERLDHEEERVEEEGDPVVRSEREGRRSYGGPLL
jgi:hypothetical protein